MNLRVLHLPQYYGESNWTAPAETLWFESEYLLNALRSIETPKRIMLVSLWKWRARLGSNQRPPGYDLLMRLSTDLDRFVSVCTGLFCNRIIVKDFRDLYRFGENTCIRTGTRITLLFGMLIQIVCGIIQDSNNNDGLQLPFSQEHVCRIICLNNPLQYFQHISLNQPDGLL